MFPAASAASVAVKPVSPVTSQTDLRASQPPAPETARSSAGESSASQIKLETSRAVTAAEQATVTPRLRDQETAEQTTRTPPTDAHAGPPPAFKESPLERQARVAFDPPDDAVDSSAEPVETSGSVATSIAPVGEDADATDTPAAEPQPTPAERAEASFAETRTISEPKEPGTVDVAH